MKKSALFRVLIASIFILVWVTPSPGGQTTLIPTGSIWKFRDTGTDLQTAWRSPAFDDSGWASGPSQLGYGDGDEATVVSYGPNSSAKYITTYFRRTFTVADPSAVAGLTLSLLRDDGAVVYVNGTEVWRTNMPSGAITSATLATTALGGADETTYLQTTISPSSLVAGSNVIAVEIHQANGTSTDISFDLGLVASDSSQTPTLTRGPYLQLGTPSSVVLKWRTDLASDSRVRFGSAPGNLTSNADSATITTDHEVRLSGLAAGTKYYYSVGTSTTALAGDDSGHYFVTSPATGTAVPTRIWVLGDSGTANANAQAVRNAYYTFTGSTPTNLWLMLGDNAYNSGTDAEYQAAVFDMYPTMLDTSVLWPTIGNHDTAQSTNPPSSLPYYSIFTLPTNAEAGGIASGTEDYYSFDYGSIHFICLDSMTSDRSPGGPMMTWLQNDLSSTLQPWIIAFWHHPPYTKGSHDSDTETALIEMRQNALPLLEAAGADLVLAGHSHSYERSYLIDGHYGFSNTFTSSMKIDGGDGRVDGTGAYTKSSAALGSHEGAVYAVAGSSGQTSGGTLNHPAMFISLNNLGSMVIDVNGNQLDAKFLRENGVVADHFTIVKGVVPPQVPADPSGLTATPAGSTQVSLAWSDNSGNEDGFRIERCAGAGCTAFAQVAQTAAGVTGWTDSGLTPATLYRYRVLAFNGAGVSGYSAVAEATTAAQAIAPTAPSNLSASAASRTQINLKWTDTSSNEDGFRIERCTGARCTGFVQIAQVAAGTTTWPNSGLTANTTYRYRVRAYNAVGNSPYSNIAQGKTPKR